MTKQTPTKANVHITVWQGSRTARIVDMTNAGKRGQMCKVLRIEGTRYNGASEASLTSVVHLLHLLEAIDPRESYYSVVKLVALLIEEARARGVPERDLSVSVEQIKGIRAPRLVLTAGVEGMWCASADENGISMCQLNDVNEWREITAHTQTNARAYEIAAKVWPDVQRAHTLQEAARILREAGARLHGYCGMD